MSMFSGWVPLSRWSTIASVAVACSRCNEDPGQPGNSVLKDQRQHTRDPHGNALASKMVADGSTYGNTDIRIKRDVVSHSYHFIHHIYVAYFVVSWWVLLNLSPNLRTFVIIIQPFQASKRTTCLF